MSDLITASGLHDRLQTMAGWKDVPESFKKLLEDFDFALGASGASNRAAEETIATLRQQLADANRRATANADASVEIRHMLVTANAKLATLERAHNDKRVNIRTLTEVLTETKAKLTAASIREARLRAELTDSARSLETLSSAGLRDHGLDTMQDVRGYANSRATVARAALAAPNDGVVYLTEADAREKIRATFMWGWENGDKGFKWAEAESKRYEP